VRVILLMLLLFSVSVSAGDKTIDDTESLKKMIEANLAVGDSREKVDQFLKSTNWQYSIDHSSSKYYATPANGAAECKNRNLFIWLFYECGIFIQLDFDSSGKYSGHSIEQQYSGL
jgi:hypothetical protein